MSTFGEILRRLRQGAGLTQEELGAASGVAVRSISDLERGRRQSPHRRTVEALAAALALAGADAALLLRAGRSGRLYTLTAQSSSSQYPDELCDALTPHRASDSRRAFTAQEAGTRHQTIRNRAPVSDTERAVAKAPLDNDERDELARLRLAERTWQAEKEILRRAAAYFAQKLSS